MAWVEGEEDEVEREDFSFRPREGEEAEEVRGGASKGL